MAQTKFQISIRAIINSTAKINEIETKRTVKRLILKRWLLEKDKENHFIKFIRREKKNK